MIAFDPNITVCLHVNAIKHNVVKIITFSQSEFVVKNILNSLRSGLALQHIGYLSSNPPHIYALFFPSPWVQAPLGLLKKLVCFMTLVILS